MISEKLVDLNVLKTFSDSVAISANTPVTVTLGDRLLEYSTDPSGDVLSRPLESPANFDWNSVQGLHLEGKEFIRERQYTKAEEKLQQCLSKDPNYLPALTDLAMVRYRNMDFKGAMELLLRALSIRQVFTGVPRFASKFGNIDLRVVNNSATSAILRWYPDPTLRRGRRRWRRGSRAGRGRRTDGGSDGGRG